MSSVAPFNPEIERELREDPTSPWFDDAFGGSGQCDERPPCQTPTASDPNPGRFELDDDSEDALNLQVRQEVERLRREVPDLRQFHITPGLHWSGNATDLSVDAMPWKVTFFAGEGLAIGDGANLAEAMTDAIGKYRSIVRAQTLDNGSGATAAEQAAA